MSDSVEENQSAEVTASATGTEEASNLMMEDVTEQDLAAAAEGVVEGGDSRPDTKSSDREKKKKKKDNGKEDKDKDSEKNGDDGDGEGKKKKKKKKDGEKDTSRELLCIRICSIQLFRLIPAHRFKKNLPWVKVAYGKSGKYEWTAPYEDSELGERADFLDLTWEFILERDTRHREDLVVTVMSEELIIGRYVLGAADFAQMPVTKSGYFRVTGQVINALGVAGDLRLVFKKVIAEPPKAPRFMEARPDTIRTNALPHTARTYVRFISIALSDLDSVHGTFEFNSPHVYMECGKWNKTTDTKVGAGMSCKWNRLPWKLVMDKFHSLTVFVKSRDSMIGNVSFSLDELRDMEPNPEGFVEIIRLLTDGAKATGRIRIYVMMRDMSPADDAETFHLPVPSIGYENETGPGGSVPAGMALAHAPPLHQKQLQQPRAGVEEEKDATVGAKRGDGAQASRKEIYKMFGNAMGLGNDMVAAQPVHPRHQGMHHVDNMITGSITFVPFIMKIKEAGVYDSRQAHPVKPNSLSLNAACGAWGGCTAQVKNSGPDAYWVGLSESWRFIVEEGSKLHLNVWSRESFVGTVALTTEMIKKYPIDPDGQTEIFLDIKDEGVSTGRLRVNCCFEYLREGENTNYNPQPEPVLYKPKGAKKLKLDQYGEVPKYELPCVARVISITAVDLKAAHTILPNSPRCRIVCERKQALTPVKKLGGNMARWTDLDWEIPINEGAIMMVYIYSGKAQIGLMELPAHHIVDEPLDKYGFTQINHLIRNHDGSSTGKISLYMQLENLPDIQVYEQVKENGAHRNPYDLNPPALQPTEAYELDPILQAMAARPFFTLADAMEAGQGVMMHVTIRELDVTDLDPVHWFGKKNSPIVSGACGRWAETTTVAHEAGESAYWVGLDWKFLMDDKLHVQFVVGSGDKVVGSVKCAAKEFSVAKMDQRGVKRMSLNMYNHRHHFAGKLKITYQLGVVREHQYIDRPKAVERLNDEDIAAPFNAVVKKITVTSMPNVHGVGPNEPRFRISHDNWSNTTPVSMSGVSEEAIWTEADITKEGADTWTVPVMDDSQPIIFSAVSGSELIGICEVSPLDVVQIPRRHGGLAEVVGTLTKDGRSMGRVQVVLALLNLSTKYQPDADEEAEAEAEAQAAARQLERQRRWAGKQQFQGEDTVKAQQEQYSYKLLSFKEEEERRKAEAEKQKAIDNFKRTKAQAELQLTRDTEMKVQHQVLIREQARHKFAPLGDMGGGGGMNTGRDTVQTSQFSLMGDNDSIAGGVNLPGMHTTHMPPTSFPSNVQFASAPLSSGQAALLSSINPKQPVPPSGLPPLLGATPAAAGGGPSPAPGASGGGSLVLQDVNDAGSVTGGASIATASTRHTARPPAGPRPDHAQVASSAVAAAGGGDSASDAGSNGSTQRKVRHPTMLQAQSRAGPDLGATATATKKKTYDKDTGIISNKFDDHEKDEAVVRRDTPATFGMVVASVAVLNCRSVHVMSKNSLQAVVECGRYSFSTDVLQSAGESGQWANLNWRLEQVDGTAIGGISLTVLSGKTVVGHVDVSADTLYQKSLAEPPGAVVKHFDEMKEGPTFCGKIRLNYVVTE